MSFSFANFSEGVGTAVAGIVAAEIGFNYGLGDFLKEQFMKLFGKAKAEQAVVTDAVLKAASEVEKKL